MDTSSGFVLFRPDDVDVTSLLVALKAIAERHQDILLVSRQEMEPRQIQVHITELEEYLGGEVDAEERSWLESNVFIWGYDRIGFVHIFGFDVPNGPSQVEMFTEWEGGGLPVGRPQIPPAMGRPKR